MIAKQTGEKRYLFSRRELINTHEETGTPDAHYRMYLRSNLLTKANGG